MSGSDRFDDGLLDEVLGSLGTPPAAVPHADAAALLARASLLAGAGAGATAGVIGLAGLKLWGVLSLVGMLAFGGGWVSRDLGAPPSSEDVELGSSALHRSNLPATAPAPVAAPVAPAPAAQPAPAVARRPEPSPRTVDASPARARSSRRPLAASADTACPEVLPAAPDTPLAIEAPARSDDSPPLIAGVEPDAEAADEPVADDPPEEDGSSGALDETPALPPLEPEGESLDASAHLTSSRRGRPTGHLLGGVGAIGGLGAWGDRAPPAGPGLTAALALVGPSPGAVRPTVRLGLEIGALMGDDERESRFVGGLQGAGGFVVGRRTVRLDLAWAVGARVMPPGVGVNDYLDDEAGWLFAVSGPEVGVAFGKPDRAGFRAAVSVQGALLDLEGDGGLTLVPWVGLTVGADVPLPGGER